MDTGPYMGSLDSQLPNFQLGGGRAGRGRTALHEVLESTKTHTNYTQILQQQNIQKYKNTVLQKNKVIFSWVEAELAEGGRSLQKVLKS